MEIRYHPGTDADFVAYIKSLPIENKEIRGIQGKNRWIIKLGGEEFILRPASAKEDATAVELSRDENGELAKIKFL